MKDSNAENVFVQGNNKFGIITLVVGGQGAGKSTFVKTCLPETKKSIIFDVNGEYIRTENVLPVQGSDIKIFLKDVKSLKNICIVIEEATVFLNNRMFNTDIMEMLIKKRHNHFNIFLIFHSLRSVPAYLYDISDFLVLFKTKDNPELMKRKYGFKGNIFNQYQYVMKHPNLHQYTVIDLLNN
jgi:energy-coupling factor transporter ATP-binding protein EcfA2